MTETVTIPAALLDKMIDTMDSMVAFLERADKAAPDPLMTCAEAAQYMGKAPGTISRWLKEGRIKKTFRGVRAGILKSDLDAMRA